jgi:hypothetical protein
VIALGDLATAPARIVAAGSLHLGWWLAWQLRVRPGAGCREVAQTHSRTTRRSATSASNASAR